MFIEVADKIINITEISGVEFNRNGHTAVLVHMKGGTTLYFEYGGTLEARKIAARKTYDCICEQCKKFNEKN